MDAKEFVANWNALKAELLAAFMAPDAARKKSQTTIPRAGAGQRRYDDQCG